LMLQSRAIQGIIVVVWFSYSYPLAVNIAISLTKAVHGPATEHTAGLLPQIQIERRGQEALAVLDSTHGTLSPLEIFERAINSVQVNSPDFSSPLSELAYVASLKDGMRAIPDACGPSARVFTADFVNPFPAILDLPEGGGLAFIQPGQHMSEQNYIAPERLFAEIDCVMVPKVPVVLDARELFLKVYGSYLDQHYEPVKQTDYWTVLRGTASRLSHTGP
ncbi:MAG: hypothetical protein JOZ17_13425, partial [Acetobacteraceae bacterium]|nr:hypothetical protein [Acetobacteraceae bacterium]